MAMFNRKSTRERLHERLRKKVNGTSDRPRLSVYFSNQHIVAQVIDDSKGVTLASASTREKNESTKGRANVAGAKVIGSIVAERAKARGIDAVVFDRGGHVYHGKVKALADAAREAGLKF